MTRLASLIQSYTVLYIAMLWPGRYVLQGLLWEELYYPWMMYDSGVWAIYLLIVTLSVSPALILLRRIGSFPRLGRWLLQRRKHFGLGSFVYACLHLAHYVKATWDLQLILSEAVAIKFAVGWLAFLIFVALALTSNTLSARKLGSRWKALHKWVYAAAALSFLHWYLFDFYTARVLYWLSILCVAKLAHIGLVQWRAHTSRTVP